MYTILLSWALKQIFTIKLLVIKSVSAFKYAISITSSSVQVFNLLSWGFRTLFYSGREASRKKVLKSELAKGAEWMEYANGSVPFVLIAIRSWIMNVWEPIVLSVATIQLVYSQTQHVFNSNKHCCHFVPDMTLLI